MLCYHQLYSDPQSNRAKYDFNLSVKQFRRQLHILRQHGYTTIRLDQLTDYLQGGSFPGGKPIVISFDDGTADFLSLAAPALREYNYSATHFIAPALIDNVPGHMKLTQLKKTLVEGYELQSHSFTYHRMNEISFDECRRELEKLAVRLLQLGAPSIKHIAYPQGIYTHDMPEILATAGYKAAYTVYGGENIPGQPLAYLNRYMVRQSDDVDTFLRKVTQRPLPLLAVKPERGSKVAAGETIRLVLPEDIRYEDLFLFIDKVAVKFTMTQETSAGKEISLIMPSPPNTKYMVSRN